MALLTTTTQAAVTELIKPTVLLTTVGSGPFGERSPASHIHTLTGALPPPLQFSLPAASKLSSLPLPQRKDIDIGPGGLAFLVDNVMSSEQCDALAAVSESIGYSRFAPAITTPPGMRQNSAAHWLPTDQHADEFFARKPWFERNGVMETVEDNAGKYGPDLLCDFLCDFMERNRSKPFFVYYPMVLVHNPFVKTPDTIGNDPRTQAANKAPKNKMEISFLFKSRIDLKL